MQTEPSFSQNQHRLMNYGAPQPVLNLMVDTKTCNNNNKFIVIENVKVK